MCLLHFGQIVECAAVLISCVALQSKHSITALWCFAQKPSSLRKSETSATCSTGSSFDRSRSWTLGAEGTKWAPHWRHIVLFAAAYSICLKPQCGHSTLTLAGDGLATGRDREKVATLLKHELQILPWQELATHYPGQSPVLKRYSYPRLRWLLQIYR